MLTAAGIGVDGQRLPYLLMHAELDALICSGPRRGKQHTYVLLEERAPDARDLPRDEALAELARRYFTSHGPGDRQGLRRVGDPHAGRGARGDRGRRRGPAGREELDGLRCWSGARAPGTAAAAPPALRSPAVHLVQGYDEYIMGYTRDEARARSSGKGVVGRRTARSPISSSCSTAASPGSGGARSGATRWSSRSRSWSRSTTRRWPPWRPRPPATASSSVCGGRQDRGDASPAISERA